MKQAMLNLRLAMQELREVVVEVQRDGPAALVIAGWNEARACANNAFDAVCKHWKERKL